MARNDAMRNALSTVIASVLMASMATTPLAAAQTGPFDVGEIADDPPRFDDLDVRPELNVQFVDPCTRIYHAKAHLLGVLSEGEGGDGGAVEEGTTHALELAPSGDGLDDAEQRVGAPVSADPGGAGVHIVDTLIPGGDSWDSDEYHDWQVSGDQYWDPELGDCVFTGEVTVTTDGCGKSKGWRDSHTVARDVPPTNDGQTPNVQNTGQWEWTATSPDQDVYEVTIEVGTLSSGPCWVSFYLTQ